MTALMRRTRKVIAGATALLAAACTPADLRRAMRDGSMPEVIAAVRAHFPDVPQTPTAALAAALADPSRPPPVLLDARARAEYDVSHLPGAMHVDPSSDPRWALAAIPAGRPVVVYCSIGWRSSAFAAKLRARGRADVSNLEGSIFQWANEGRRLESNATPARTVHPYDEKWGKLLRAELRAF